MAKLSDNFEKSKLDLLVEFKSDETIKTRRNITIAAFILICLYYLELPLSTLKVFGIELSNTNPGALSIIGCFLFTYWSLALIIYLYRDIEFNRERKFLLDREVSKVKAYKAAQEEKLQEKMGDNSRELFKQRLRDVTREFEIYENQISRTKKYSIINNAIIYFETATPFILSVISIFIIVSS